jgi:hypothetical protein
MKYSKRSKKKVKDPVDPIRAHLPPSNGAGLNPTQIRSAAIIREYAMLKLAPDKQDVFIDLQNGFDDAEIARRHVTTIEWVKECKKEISIALQQARKELQATL